MDWNITSQSTETYEATVVENDSTTTLPAKVILFNDEVHTFDDVIIQLIKAIKCTPDEGEKIAWEVHTRGKAVVYSGEINQCLRVSSVLEEIALHTQIEY